MMETKLLLRHLQQPLEHRVLQKRDRDDESGPVLANVHSKVPFRDVVLPPEARALGDDLLEGYCIQGGVGVVVVLVCFPYSHGYVLLFLLFLWLVWVGISGSFVLDNGGKMNGGRDTYTMGGN